MCKFCITDIKCPNSDDCIESAKSFLCNYLELDEEDVKNMQVFYQYHQLEREDLYKLIFNKDNIIVTFSMYAKGSQNDLLFFLKSAAKNDVKGVTYIDTSGCMIKFLNRNLRDVEKDAFAVISAVNTNNIISIDWDSEIFPDAQIIKINVAGYHDDCVSLENFTNETLIPFSQ